MAYGSYVAFGVLVLRYVLLLLTIIVISDYFSYGLWELCGYWCPSLEISPTTPNHLSNL